MSPVSVARKNLFTDKVWEYKWIYEIPYTWTAENDLKVWFDHHSYAHNLRSRPGVNFFEALNSQLLMLWA